MFGILKFQTFLLVVLLFICSCTYLHGVFPAWLDRNKSGYASLNIRHVLHQENGQSPMLTHYLDPWELSGEQRE